jgi:uncharacterized protein YbaP (TraB family)
MFRILADLPDDGIEWLDQRTAEQGRSRDQLLSEIVRWYVAKIRTSA